MLIANMYNNLLRSLEIGFAYYHKMSDIHI